MRRYTAKEIVAKLDEAEQLMREGMTQTAACNYIDITAATYFRWNKLFRGMRPRQIEMVKARMLEKRLSKWRLALME